MFTDRSGLVMIQQYLCMYMFEMLDIYKGKYALRLVYKIFISNYKQLGWSLKYKRLKLGL